MRARLAGGGEVDNDIAVTVESAGVAHVGIVVRRDVDVVVFGPADALQVDRDRRPRGSRSRRNVDDAGLDDEVRPCDEVVASANGQSVQTAEVVRNRQRPIDSAVDVGCDFANLVFLRREAAVRHPAPDRGLPDQPHRRTGREAFALQNGARADGTCVGVSVSRAPAIDASVFGIAWGWYGPAYATSAVAPGVVRNVN